MFLSVFIPVGLSGFKVRPGLSIGLGCEADFLVGVLDGGVIRCGKGE